jgi:hypothetical protein
MSSILPASYGLHWHHSLDNRGLNSPPIVRKVVASAYASNIGIGDVVLAVNDGTVALTPGTEGTPGLSGWVVAYVERYKNPGDGLVRSGHYLPSSSSLTYTGSASLDNPFATVLGCIPCRGQVFEAVALTTGTSWAAIQAYVGEYADFTRATIDTVSGMAQIGIAISTHSASSGQFVISDVPVYGLGQNTMNDPTAAGFRILVTVNPSEIGDIGI